MKLSSSLYSPNGQWGCWTVRVGVVTVCVGFIPDLFGFDLAWRGTMLITTNNLLTVNRKEK